MSAFRKIMMGEGRQADYPQNIENYYTVALIHSMYPEDDCKRRVEEAQEFNPVSTKTKEGSFGTWLVFVEFDSLTLAFELYNYWEQRKVAYKTDIQAYFDRELLSIWKAPEKRIQAQLQKKLGGKIEVVTPLGRIDLLTDTEIIEIKPFKDWKAALGQLIVYSKFYPHHKKRLYLFAKQTPKNLKIISEACAEYNIAVDFEIDKGRRHG